MLTRAEKVTLHNAERFTKEVWRIVAKDQGCSLREYAGVHYWQRLADFQTALERNPIGDADPHGDDWATDATFAATRRTT